MSQHELIFHDTLTRFWRLVFAEWGRLHKTCGCEPFKLTATNLNTPPFWGYIPPEKDRIELSFGSRLFPGPLSEVIEVEAVAMRYVPEARVRLRVYTSTSATEAHRQDARSKWHKVRQALQEKVPLGASSGWHLQDMPEPLRTKASEPAKDAPLDAWFDWYHRALEVGLKVTHEDIARKTNYTAGTVRKKHMLYKNSNY